MSKADLESRHLAQLHALAAEAGVPRYRLLPREELIEELLVRGADGSDRGGEGAEAPRAEPRPRRGRRRRREGAEHPRAEREERKEPSTEEGRRVSGVLDVVRAGHGFLRLDGLEEQEGDVYISASQIRRCELRPGDRVEGPAREPRRGERHRALIRVELVNGAPPEAEERTAFEDLTPVPPTRRLPIEPPAEDFLTRAADLLAPLAYGQRILVVAEPRSGRTTLLRGLVSAITAAPAPPAIVVLLADERPEEVTAWKRHAEGADIAAASADLGAAEQTRLADLAVSGAKRRVEAGEDVVLVIDSLTRLARAFGDPSQIKPIFGAGRELEEEGSGSLTVIATVLRGTEDGDGATEAVATTENATIALDAGLARAGIFPAIDPSRTSAAGEEALRDDEELAAVRRLRAELYGRDPADAAAMLAERLTASATNAELLRSS